MLCFGAKMEADLVACEGAKGIEDELAITSGLPDSERCHPCNGYS